jgi:hypothetical protein
MANREYDYLFKLVSNSSLILRFADHKSNESNLTTIGVEFR